jgi:hypothetical protein
MKPCTVGWNLKPLMPCSVIGPLDPDELAWMRRVGDHVYGRAPMVRLMD